MSVDEEVLVKGTRYIRADIAERWKAQRDLLMKFKLHVHRMVHEVRRDVKAVEEEAQQDG